MCLECHLMDTWLKEGNLGNLKKMVIIHMFHLQFIHSLLRLDQCKILTQNVKMDDKKKFHRSLQNMQLQPMYRCKFISEAEIEFTGLYHFCETHLVFEDPDAREKEKQEGN